MARTQQVAERPPQQNAVAAIQHRQNEALQTFTSDLDRYAHRFRDALPSHIPVERFKRVVVTAVANNPDLLGSDRRSLFNACMRAAADGLLPDGREGALVSYNTKVKLRDPQEGIDREVRMDVVQWMPMIAGIRKRLYNSGEVLSFTAEAVFEKDRFRYSLGDNPFIEHEPPALGADRGQVVGAYAIIRLRNGEVIRDVMDKATIEKARNQGRAKDSLMWTTFYHEGAKKTVARRAAKQAPFSSDLDRLFQRDEEEIDVHSGPDFIDHEPAQPAKREPEPQPAIETRPAAPASAPPPENTGPQFGVWDLDGVESIFASGFRAYDALRALMTEAEGRGMQVLDGFWESNQEAIELLASAGFGDQAAELASEYDAARQRLKAKAQANQPAAEQGQPAHAANNDTATATAPTTTAAPAHQDNATPPAAAAEPERIDEQGRPSMTIPPVVKQGKEDWRTWTVALFMPKLRRQRDSRTLAFLLGDNEAHLQQARAVLAKDDLTELEEAIKAQWKFVENG